MSTPRSLVIGITALLASATLAQDVRAEVAAETDAYGTYVRTSIIAQASTRQFRVWRTVRRQVRGLWALNPDGDRTGDLYPTVAENPANGNHPIAVWSRFNGIDFDLAWSNWQPDGWTPIRWVSGPFDPGDDLGPSAIYDSSGRPHVAWWRDEGGTGRVYLSLYLLTRWSTPFAVSDAGVDSRAPTVSFLPDGRIQVEFSTPAGPDVRVVEFHRPSTILDDLDPFNHFVVTRLDRNSGREAGGLIPDEPLP